MWIDAMMKEKENDEKCQRFFRIILNLDLNTQVKDIKAGSEMTTTFSADVSYLFILFWHYWNKN